MAVHTDHGLAADLSDADDVGALCIIGDALALLGMAWLGNPESTTDTIASSVVTVAATRRISAVR
jgi:phosphate/sulfate permease